MPKDGWLLWMVVRCRVKFGKRNRLLRFTSLGYLAAVCIIFLFAPYLCAVDVIIYSKTSFARTLNARLPRLFRTRS